MREGKEIRLQCLSMGVKLIMPARPHLFKNGILHPIQRCREKARRSSENEQLKLSELWDTNSVKPDEKVFIHI